MYTSNAWQHVSSVQPGVTVLVSISSEICRFASGNPNNPEECKEANCGSNSWCYRSHENKKAPAASQSAASR